MTASVGDHCVQKLETVIAVFLDDFNRRSTPANRLRPSADPTGYRVDLESGRLCASLPISSPAGSATQAQIWDTRLRSYNAIGNPNFEVDQRLSGTFNIGASFVPNEDRWMAYKSGAMTATANGGLISGLVSIPGTSFAITQKFFRFTLTGQQTTLGASDQLKLAQFLEGIQLRELISDVSSCQILVRSSVSGLSFGLAWRDSAAAYSLTKLITVPSANTWSILTMPNLPVWTPSGNFPIGPGVLGCYFDIVLAAGSTLTSPANNTWQAGNFIGAAGQSNFAASQVNSTFDIAFVQHEPGPLCTTLMDKPFSQNLDECLRYYQKSYDYGTAVGGITTAGAKMMIVPTGLATGAVGPLSFHKPMAKIPSMFLYNHATGAANIIRDGAGVDHTAAGATNIGLSGFPSISFSTAVAAGGYMTFHYTADAGW